MQSTAIITESLNPTKTRKVKKLKIKKPINRYYLYISGIVLFYCLLLFLGTPLWMVLILGLGISFVLFVLYIIQGIQLVLDLNEKELEEAIKQDLDY